MKSSRVFDVIAVGAGVAGLSAAAALKDRGYSVLVLEARERIGGRVLSAKTMSGLTIDLGAQLIGDSQTRLSRLVDQFGLTRVPLLSKGWTAHFDAESKQVVYEKDKSLPLSMLGTLDALQAMWRVDSRLKSYRSDADTLDRLPATEFIEELGFTDEAVEAFRSYAESELCSSPDDWSAYELLDQISAIGGTDGEANSAQWCLAEGMGAVAEQLAAPILANLRLSAPVNAVNASAHGYVVSCQGDDIRTERLLITVPPHMYGRVGLNHLLPKHRRQVVESYVQGAVVKTILVFDEPWWRKRGASGLALSRGGLFGSVIDASPADGSAGVLVIFSTASWAIRLQRISETEARVEAAIRWLADLSGGAIPRPKSAYSVDWNADPWSLGGYASRRRTGGWLQAPDLFEPYDGIHFAGSETADEWRSFVEGALQSAERATLEIERSLAGW